MYRLELNYISRDGGKKGKRDAAKQGHGFSAIAAVAHRSGGIVTDYRTSEVHDYTRKWIGYTKSSCRPERRPGPATARPFECCEAAEVRKDARLAHEFIVAVPHGLTPEQEVPRWCATCQSVADRYSLPVDLPSTATIQRGGDGPEKGVVGAMRIC